MNNKYKEPQEQVNLRVSRWRERNRIHSRELNNKEYQKNRAKRLIYKKEYNLKNKEKIKSHNLAKSITFEKSICSKCGSTENIIKHHEDYSKPLEVILLCKKCHNRLHKSVQETDTAEVTELLSKPEKSRPDILNTPDCKDIKSCTMCKPCADFCYDFGKKEGAKAERERILSILFNYCYTSVDDWERIKKEITEGSTSDD